MNRVKCFVGLAAVVLLVGTASLAQAGYIGILLIGRLVRRGQLDRPDSRMAAGSVIDNNGTATIASRTTSGT